MEDFVDVLNKKIANNFKAKFIKTTVYWAGDETVMVTFNYNGHTQYFYCNPWKLEETLS